MHSGLDIPRVHYDRRVCITLLSKRDILHEPVGIPSQLTKGQIYRGVDVDLSRCMTMTPHPIKRPYKSGLCQFHGRLQVQPGPTTTRILSATLVFCSRWYPAVAKPERGERTSLSKTRDGVRGSSRPKDHTVTIAARRSTCHQPGFVPTTPISVCLGRTWLLCYAVVWVGI